MILIDKLPTSLENALSRQFNTKAITVWVSKETFYIQPNYKKSLIPTVLKIDRLNKQIKQIKLENFQPPQNFTPHYYSFFIGIISLKNKKVLFLAEQVQLVCSIKQRDTFRITKPILIFYNSKQKYELDEEQAKLLINIVFVFEQGMYFSFSYNLTQPIHFLKSSRKGNLGFNWAKKFQKQLDDFDGSWSLPVIQGNVGKMQVFINGRKFMIILISRRSILKGGPYHFSLGIDENGNVANYVQTQLIIQINDLLFSFIQIRGSAPIFWSQNLNYGILKKINCYKTIEQNASAFRKHMNKIKKDLGYEQIILLNLLSSNSIESKLIQNYQYIVKSSLDIENLYYTYFDIHKQCQQKSYDPLAKFITQQFKDILRSCQFTVLQQQSKNNFQILQKQKGIIRSNCLYCIDRTNITQSKMSAFVLLQILRHLDINITSFTEDLKFSENQQPFGQLYRNLWADNSDQLSKQYTGTGSTQSYAIRKGKLSYITSIDHGMTSITRVLRNIRQQDLQKNTAVLFLVETDEKAQQRIQSGHQ